MTIEIDLSPPACTFQAKPLLVGGKAMEYYHLRKAGDDIDFLVAAHDYANLAQRYPAHVQDLFGDLGVSIYGFELWKCIRLFGYDFLGRGAVELDTIKVASLEKLLFLKALAMDEPKYEYNVRLIAKKINDIQYGKDAAFGPGYFA